MTLFRKYYKDANNDIRADEAFINSVIENSRKPRVPSRKSYFKYALTAAAAVVVMSATAIALPILTDNTDDGVIIVAEQTAQPSEPTAVPSPQTTAAPQVTTAPKPAATPLWQTPTTGRAVAEQGAATAEIAEEKQEEKRAMFSFSVKETPSTNDFALSKETVTVAGTADTLEDTASYDDTMKTSGGGSIAPAAGVTTDSGADCVNNTPHKSTGGGGGSIAAPAMQISISPPNGYRISGVSSNRYVFVSDDGAVITVIIKSTKVADTAPVYNGSTVSFNAHGISFNITFDGAEKSAVDELVNSLR